MESTPSQLITALTLDEYQTKASEFRQPSAPPEERVMGLLEEAGEVAGVFKRLLRGDYTIEETGPKLIKELGDVLWYLGQVALDNKWKLSDVAQQNLSKLESRKFRNMLLGKGDER